MKRLFLYGLLILILVAPLFVGAQPADIKSGYIDDLISTVYRIINNLIPIIIGIGILFFLWFAFTLVRNPGDEEAKTKLLWAVIFLAVALSVWGLVGILQNIFGVRDATLRKEQLPQLPTGVIRAN